MDQKYDAQAMDEYMKVQEIRQLEDGSLIGNLGALWYLLDENKRPVSPGCHQIVPGEHGYRCEIGANSFYFDRTGRVTGVSSRLAEAMRSGYVKLGDYSLDDLEVIQEQEGE